MDEKVNQLKVTKFRITKLDEENVTLKLKYIEDKQNLVIFYLPGENKTGKIKTTSTACDIELADKDLKTLTKSGNCKKH